MSMRKPIPATKQYPTFDRWLRAVDDAVGAKSGLSIHDLPDVPLRDWFEDGIRPNQAAARAIRAVRE